jgi:Type II secretory pathway, component PulF
MVGAGENSGNLSSSLIYLSRIYEDEMDNSTKNLSASVEPALMVFMGILVGFVAVSIIQPIYGITTFLQK